MPRSCRLLLGGGGATCEQRQSRDVRRLVLIFGSIRLANATDWMDEFGSEPELEQWLQA